MSDHTLALCGEVDESFTSGKSEIAIFEYINGFYNPRRRHSALGWKSPVAFERKVAETITWGGNKARQVQFAPHALSEHLTRALAGASANGNPKGSMLQQGTIR